MNSIDPIWINTMQDRTGKTPMKEKIERVTTDKRVQPSQESLTDETRLKQGIEEKVPT